MDPAERSTTMWLVKLGDEYRGSARDGFPDWNGLSFVHHFVEERREIAEAIAAAWVQSGSYRHATLAIMGIERRFAEIHEVRALPATLYVATDWPWHPIWATPEEAWDLMKQWCGGEQTEKETQRRATAHDMRTAITVGQWLGYDV